MDLFWDTVGVNQLAGPSDVTQALTAVRGKVGQLEVHQLEVFDGVLRQRIFGIDKRRLAEVPVVLPNGTSLPQTDDHFLYARCACVLAGRETYLDVLHGAVDFDPFVDPQLQGAEALLYLAAEQFALRTGLELRAADEFPIEAGSNTLWWA